MYEEDKLSHRRDGAIVIPLHVHAATGGIDRDELPWALRWGQIGLTLRVRQERRDIVVHALILRNAPGAVTAHLAASVKSRCWCAGLASSRQMPGVSGCLSRSGICVGALWFHSWEP